MVNNLATSRSITWPHFSKNFGKCGQVIDLEVFTCFLLKLVFFSKISFSLQKEEYFENKKPTKINNKVAKLLTYGGQVIDPTAYIYIYNIYI